MFSRAPRLPTVLTTALTGLILSVLACGAHAATEQEQITGAPNDAISLAEPLGTLNPGSALVLDGSRRVDWLLPNYGGGTSADYFAFSIDGPLQVDISIQVPDARHMPVIGLFGMTPGGRVLLDSAADSNADTSTVLSFSHQLDAQGTYYVAVSGYRTNWDDFDGGGDSGWTYRLTVANEQAQPRPIPTPTPVPENPLWVMMLAGVGVLGLKARRQPAH
jgi:hypothetical protein